MKRDPWIPLWAAFQDDPSVLSVSAEAELLFVRAVALSRLRGAEGVVHAAQLRHLCDKFTADPAELCRQLCEAIPKPLWVDLGDGRYSIPSFSEWNQPKSERSAAAKSANHSRWKHPGHVDNCERCYPQADGPKMNGNAVSPSQRPKHPPGVRSDSDGVLEKNRTEEKSLVLCLPKTPVDNSGTDDDDLASLTERLFTIVGDAPNRADQPRIHIALKAGNTPKDLIDLAETINARTDVRKPGPYLRKAIDDRTKQPPPPKPRRPLLDDEKPECARCHTTGWIDAEGGVERCPDCTPHT